MRSLKQILNEWAQKSAEIHIMTPHEMEKLRSLLIDMYLHIYNICEQNNLTVMFAGGSCLGAVRHQGFIPWDDDLDLMMARPDYNKLVNLCKSGALGDDYVYCYPDGQRDSPSSFLKIYKCNTILQSVGEANSPFPKGVFIDIFPLDGVPKTKLAQRFKGVVANTLRFISNCVSDYVYADSTFDDMIKTDKELASMMDRRKFIGKIFSIVPHKKWVCLFDKFVEEEDINGEMGSAAGRCLYNGEIHPNTVFFPVTTALFEGIEVKIPGQIDTYLKRLYGSDYMQLPPLDKRETHFVVKFKI